MVHISKTGTRGVIFYKFFLPTDTQKTIQKLDTNDSPYSPFTKRKKKKKRPVTCAAPHLCLAVEEDGGRPRLGMGPTHADPRGGDRQQGT